VVVSGLSTDAPQSFILTNWQAHMTTHNERRSWQLQLFILPCVLLIGALVVYPALYSIYLSLTNASLVGVAATNPRFVGMLNYVRLFNDGGFWHSLVVTFWFVLGSAVIGQFVLGLASAVLLHRPLRFKNLINSIILLPNAVPEVVAGYIWISMLAGGEHSTLNRLLGGLGIPSVQWLQQFPLLMIIVANTWRGIASAMILMMAGLSAVPPEICEAARIDGASPRQIFRFITLPLIMPNIFLYMLISTVTTISIFGFIYALTRGGPGNATEIIGIYIYNQSFTAFQLGYGSAVAVVTLVISTAIGLVYVRALKVQV
jgi:multiple sugar transport system permease protein